MSINLFRKKKTNVKAKPKQKAKASTRAVRFAEVDLNEDDEDVKADRATQSSSEDEGEDDEEEDGEEEEGDPSEFIDILDVLDGRGEPDLGDEAAIGKVKPPPDLKTNGMEINEDSDGDEDMDGSEEESGEEDADEQDEDVMVSASEAEDGEDGETALLELESFVSGLDAGQKRKAPDEDDVHDGTDMKRTRKRRLLPERTEAGIENEFAPALGAYIYLPLFFLSDKNEDGGRLNLDDLLAPLEGQSSNLLSLKKSAKVLSSTSSKIKTLSAPLPQRTAERLDREAAYEQTKEEVDKWKATMQRIQQVCQCPCTMAGC